MFQIFYPTIYRLYNILIFFIATLLFMILDALITSPNSQTILLRFQKMIESRKKCGRCGKDKGNQNNTKTIKRNNLRTHGVHRKINQPIWRMPR